MHDDQEEVLGLALHEAEGAESRAKARKAEEDADDDAREMFGYRQGR